VEGNRERASGERASGDGLFQDAERARKPIILRSKIAREKGKSRLSIRQRQVQGYFVN
jgi:hypothetical protein